MNKVEKNIKKDDLNVKFEFHKKIKGVSKGNLSNFGEITEKEFLKLYNDKELYRFEDNEEIIFYFDYEEIKHYVKYLNKGVEGSRELPVIKFGILLNFLILFILAFLIFMISDRPTTGEIKNILSPQKNSLIPVKTYNLNSEIPTRTETRINTEIKTNSGNLLIK